MTKYVVAVYLQDRAYGGPEEGGWWYNCGEHVRTMRTFGREDRAVAYCRKLNDKLDRTLNRDRRKISSVLSEGRYRAEVYDDHAPPIQLIARHYE